MCLLKISKINDQITEPILKPDRINREAASATHNHKIKIIHHLEDPSKMYRGSNQESRRSSKNEKQSENNDFSDRF